MPIPSTPQAARPSAHAFLFAAVAIALVVLSACSRYQAEWTAERVAPPPSLADALVAADLAAERGEQPTTHTLTRDGAILTALSRNRSLAVERYNPLIAETLAPEARAAFDPRLLATTSFGKSTFQRTATQTTTDTRRNLATDVELSNAFPTGTQVFLSGGIDRETRSTLDGSQYIANWSAGVNQSLLRGMGTDVNLVSLRQARNEEAISMAQLRDFVMELAATTETAYWELALAYETEQIREFSLELAREQVRINRDLYEVGSALRADVLTAEAEVAERRADLVDARSEVRRRTLDLIRLLGPDDASHWLLTFELGDLPEVEQVEIDPALSAQLALQYRPDLAESRLRLENRRLEIVRTRNGLLPRLDAFASYGRRAARSNIGDAVDATFQPRHEEYDIGLQFEMQPLNRAERARDSRARFQRDQAEAAIDNLAELLELEVRLAAVEAERQWERIVATEEVVAGRQEQLRAAQEQVFAGLITTLDALQIQRDFVQAQVDLATSRIRYIQALTELFRREGTLLDRRGIGAPRVEEIARADDGNGL